MRARYQIGIASAVMFGIAVVLGLVKFIQIRQAIAEHANFKMPPESVTTFEAKEVVWNNQWKTIGSIAAIEGAELAAEEAGRVSKIGVESGARVEKGQMLLELDTSVEEADLKGALARLEQARQNLVRVNNLKIQSATSAATVEEAQSRVRQSDAEVGSLKASIDRKKITAPFAGRVGIRMVNIGQYVSQGTLLLPLFSIDPVYVNFSVPQQVSSKVTPGSKVLVRVDAASEKTFEGTVSAINPNIDQATRNLSIQAKVNNTDEFLRPGMFANVSMDFGDKLKYVVIPVSGISYAPYGDSVYIVNTAKLDDGTEKLVAKNQIVHLGERRGDFVAVLSGVKVGDSVISTGAFKLRDGVDLVIHNEKAPKLSENPEVQDS
jgi:membrane fusion protein (multidrug efflux system)